MKCFFCGGPAHPATGHAYSDTCMACGPCYREFLRFYRGRLANPIARASQGNYGPHVKRKRRG
jgi:hypothetical protein